MDVREAVYRVAWEMLRELTRSKVPVGKDVWRRYRERVAVLERMMELAEKLERVDEPLEERLRQPEERQQE